MDGAGDTGEKTASIIVVDKGNGVTDVFYMYFWAFNWGGVVLENQLGMFKAVFSPTTSTNSDFVTSEMYC